MPASGRKISHEMAIAPAQERWIGRSIIAWTRLEQAIEEVAWAFLNVTVEDGRIITSRLDAKFKIGLVRELSRQHFEKDRFKRFNKSLNTILDLYDERNLIAHGFWVTLLPDKIPAVQSLRDRLPEGMPMTEVHTHTMPRVRMTKNIKAMNIWRTALFDLRDQIRASPAKPAPPPRKG